MILTSAGLTPDQEIAVVGLQRECEAADGLDLKLELAHAAAGSLVDTFLAFDGNRLVGYAGIDAGRDAEVCGMVHPGHRRRGVGAALLNAALVGAGRAGRHSVLVICDDASAVALGWMQRRGATLALSEFRMSRAIDSAASPAVAGARVRIATPADRPELARLLSEAFDENPASVAERLNRTEATPGEETLMVYAGETLVGTTRVINTARRPMIYGFVVDAALRGRGHGRSMLQATLNLLRERGASEVALEVDTANTAAVRLYQSCGFGVVATYRYMRVQVLP